MEAQSEINTRHFLRGQKDRQMRNIAIKYVQEDSKNKDASLDDTFLVWFKTRNTSGPGDLVS